MSKYLMYVVALALSIAVAACATRSQPTQGHRTPIIAADAVHRGQAAYNRQDYLTAFREWLPLAQQGIALAQNNLGFMYAEGQGVAQDDAQAVRWYHQAAAQGFTPAQNNLGLMYAEGRGVIKDEAKAVQLYKEAAAMGFALAQNNLGFMYAEGRGVAKDDAQAVRWYHQAAAQGNAYAHANLGQMYEQGRGVARDLVEAQRWYAKAAELYPPGPNRAAAIVARDRVARQFASSQAHSAQPFPSPTPPATQSHPPVISQGTPLPPPVNPRPSVSDAEEIPLVKVGGVYALPVEINGVLRLKFVLDSGAAEVNMPADVVFTLLRSGTITNDDFLPGKTYVLADGSELRSPRFIIRSLKIGRHQITNVPASVGTLASHLLLGQSMLEKLGTWGIDNQRKVLLIRPATP